jgi:RluA family pseudouridine synthase
MPPILYEDNNLVAVDKPGGLAAIPERQADKDCLLHQMSRFYSYKLFVVHRLDKEVSGVILFAKNPVTHQYLNELFNHHQIKKNYQALVHGNVIRDAGEINTPIRQYGSGRMAVDREQGKKCLTMYHVQKRYGHCTLVTVSPITGRRHQIRVHFYSIGHPIVGDITYGNKKIQRTFPRLMLHACKIEFKLESGVSIEIESPVPKSFSDVLAMMKIVNS